MGVVLGIDLGTSFSSAAAVRGNKLVVVEGPTGERVLPSIVHFGERGEVSVGEKARALSLTNNENTIHSAKRLLGSRFGDGAVRIAQSAYLYKITQGPNRWPMYEVNGGPYTVPAVCSMVLRELRSRSEQFFGEKIEQAVITVPANATDAQREQTRVAGRIAGLEVIGLVNEPTAAALAYAALRSRGRTVAVYDFGGGTFDCSIIEWQQRAAKVLATHGDSFLGGDDIDMEMAMAVAKDFQRRTGVDIRGRAADWKRLVMACESAKRTLSTKPTTALNLPKIAHTQSGAVDLRYDFDRQRLDHIASPMVQQTIELLREALSMASLDASQLDHLLLVGGSSRLPIVKSSVQRALGIEPRSDLDPETAVCLGAALEAHRLLGGRSPGAAESHDQVVDVVPHHFGLATAGGGFDPVIKRNSPLPTTGRRSYTTWREGQREMRFVVLQGESARADDNARLGEFVVSDLPARPAGQVMVELLFAVDTNGLLKVTARESSSGKVHELSIRINDGVTSGEP